MTTIRIRDTSAAGRGQLVVDRQAMFVAAAGARVEGLKEDCRYQMCLSRWSRRPDQRLRTAKDREQFTKFDEVGVVKSQIFYQISMSKGRAEESAEAAASGVEGSSSDHCRRRCMSGYVDLQDLIATRSRQRTVTISDSPQRPLPIKTFAGPEIYASRTKTRVSLFSVRRETSGRSG